ncbi:hypothetical protein [Nitrosopumilus ureiphilus]|uniref:Uncharacterized protein n=1 Tax=Nitrosopumilus ureiphilus TaxID=1470067 RepID=A0A7D5M6W4_9ARCH|nr:hypothetical protein [Nitrosopumilus ureiphilus]QLH06427.1 hypothetical protein C5F50_04560 [Nitrosopumilus ureiphilus]
MVNLNEVIATILSDLALARVQADIESIKIAETYANDPLLKNLSIPRMRLRSVSISLPVAIDKVDERKIAESKKPISRNELLQVTQNSFENTISKRKLSMSRNDSDKIKKSLGRKIILVEKELPWIMNDAVTLSNVISNEVGNKLEDVRVAEGKKLTSVELRETIDEIKLDLKRGISNLRRPPNLEVSVNTGELKNMSPKETLAGFNLTIDEDGMEWSTWESNSGVVKKQLVPE